MTTKIIRRNAASTVDELIRNLQEIQETYAEGKPMYINDGVTLSLRVTETTLTDNSKTYDIELSERKD